MGIINVTPDSFSDGGRFASIDAAVTEAERMFDDGAAILDVGGESTRPGASPVGIEEEISRVIPVLSQLAKKGYCVSVDTRHAEVMRAAIDSGASIVNDVYALRAADAVQLCAAAKVGVVLMHMQGEPGTMQTAPHYENVVAEVSAFLRNRAQVCEAAGIARERIALDPGFGFGKTTAHNLALTRSIEQLARIGYPIVTGWSRKRTIGELTQQAVAANRVSGSVAAAIACVARGSQIVRVHDVRSTVDALSVWHAIERS
jgi:dihydropteroate synthase